MLKRNTVPHFFCSPAVDTGLAILDSLPNLWLKYWLQRGLLIYHNVEWVGSRLNVQFLRIWVSIPREEYTCDAYTARSTGDEKKTGSGAGSCAWLHRTPSQYASSLAYHGRSIQTTRITNFGERVLFLKIAQYFSGSSRDRKIRERWRKSFQQRRKNGVCAAYPRRFWRIFVCYWGPHGDTI